MAASFPMYDWPEIRAATDAWWSGLARAFRAEGMPDVPDCLLHDVNVADLWSAPDLLISQTCGYPLTHDWSGMLQVVATPHYVADGCDGAEYCSFILVRRSAGIGGLEELRGRTAAFNGEDSQSGYSAFRAAFAVFAKDGRFFGSTVKSGAHIKSMQMVAAGTADVCAVDAVVWALARRHCPQIADDLTPIALSPSSPGLPYVTSPALSENDLARLKAGLRTAFADPALADIRAELLLCGMSELDDRAYARISEIERSSASSGYHTLG